MKKVLISVFVVIFMVFAPFSVLGNKNLVSAALVGGPFGGQVLKIDRFCAGGFTFILGPPSPGLYFYPYFAVTYLYGPPNRPGKWALGLASAGVVCVAGKKTYPTQYTVIMIGTSL